MKRSFLGTFCLKIIVVWDKNWPKMTMLGSLKIVNFDRTLAFYLRGYGIKCFTPYNPDFVKIVTLGQGQN